MVVCCTFYIFERKIISSIHHLKSLIYHLVHVFKYSLAQTRLARILNFDTIVALKLIFGNKTITSGERILSLSRLFEVSNIMDIGKQCWPRSDPATRGVWLGNTLFALDKRVNWLKIKWKLKNQTSINSQMKSSNL